MRVYSYIIGVHKIHGQVHPKCHVTDLFAHDPFPPSFSHLVKDRKMLEKVQKFECRLAAHQWDASYEELLE